MKIDFEDKTIMTFNNLVYGSVFTSSKFKDSYWMKIQTLPTDTLNNAVNLENGFLTSFELGEVVYPVKYKFTVER